MDTEQILNQRAATHGSFETFSKVEQELKSVLHASPNWVKLPAAHKSALDMLCNKLARHMTGDFLCYDHMLDAVGYLQRLLDCTKNLPGAYEIVTTRRSLSSKSRRT